MKRLMCLSLIVLLASIAAADEVITPKHKIASPKLEMNLKPTDMTIDRVISRGGLKRASLITEPVAITPFFGADTFIVGRTFYDMQHNTTCGRNIVVDSDGNAHVSFMISTSATLSPRHVNYNYVHGNTVHAGMTGVQVDGDVRSGYTNITLAPYPSAANPEVISEVPIVAFHADRTGSGTIHTSFSWDNGHQIDPSEHGGFTEVYPFPPFAYSNMDSMFFPELHTCPSIVDLEAIWPRVAADENGNVFLVSTPSADDTLCGVPMPDYLVFWRGEPIIDGGIVTGYNFSGPYLVDVQLSISVDMVYDTVTNRLALIYISVFDSNDCEHYSPDGGEYYSWLQAQQVFVRFSTDGGETWTPRQAIIGGPYVNPTELENILVPAYKDSAVAPGETLGYTWVDTLKYSFWRPMRYYSDLTAAFDPRGDLHVVFQATGLFHSNLAEPCSIMGYGYQPQVYLHWQEGSSTLSKVMSPRYMLHSVTTGHYGARDELWVLKASLGFDIAGNAYVAWLQPWPAYYEYWIDSLTRYVIDEGHIGLSAEARDDVDRMFYNIVLAHDTSYYDLSEGNVANYEICIAKSTDDGNTWSKPLVLSNTPSEGCAAGDCRCELDISIARKVDDYVHLFMVMDRDAGEVVGPVGSAANDNVLYARVPVATLNAMWNAVVLTGHVYDSTSGDPLWGALVIVQNQEGTVTYNFGATNENGEYSVRVPKNIPVKVTATAIDTSWPDAVITGTWTTNATHEFYLGGSGIKDKVGIPGQVSINANPNPFNSAVQITWSVDKQTEATVEILDITGKTVKVLHNGTVSTGTHSSTWDGTDSSGKPLPSGTYLCRIKAGEKSSSTKVELVR